VQMTDPIWDWLYAPLARAVSATADRLNRLQFLTIRQFLTLVFCALVILLVVLAVWS
jgi:hydrogenase-4 component B